MNDYAADLKRLHQTHVLPGLAAVGGFVDAVSTGHRVARIILPRPHPNDIRIGRRRANIADGDGRLTVELVLERDPVVDGFE